MPGASFLLANNFIMCFSCSYCFELQGLPDSPVATCFFEEGEVTEIDVDGKRRVLVLSHIEYVEDT